MSSTFLIEWFEMLKKFIENTKFIIINSRINKTSKSNSNSNNQAKFFLILVFP